MAGPMECCPKKCPYCWELYCIISGAIFLLAVPCFIQLSVYWPAVGFGAAFIFCALSATGGCLRKKGKDLSACRQGFGLIANVTVFGLALVALLAGAAFWFYVAISNGDHLDASAADRYLCGISFTVASKWAATILVNIIGSRIQGDADFMDEDNKDEVMLQTA